MIHSTQFTCLVTLTRCFFVNVLVPGLRLHYSQLKDCVLEVISSDLLYDIWVKSKGPVINYRGRELHNMRGQQVKFYPYNEKIKGGGGGVQSVRLA